MKKIRLFRLIVFLLILVLPVIFGCTKNDFSTNTYKTLKSAQVVYDTTMKVTSKMKVEGSLSQEKWDKISKVANKFRLSGQLVARLMKTYSKNIKDNPSGDDITGKSAVKTAIGVMLINYKELLVFTQEIGILKIPQLD